MDFLSAWGVEALLLLSAETVARVSDEYCLSDSSAVVTVLLRAPFDDLLRERLPIGKSLGTVLLGPWAAQPLVEILQRPLALWAEERNSGEVSPPCECEAEDVCVALRPTMIDSVLATILHELYEEGLLVSGLRMAFPSEEVTKAATSGAVKGGLGHRAAGVASCRPWTWSAGYLACHGRPDRSTLCSTHGSSVSQRALWWGVAQ